MTLYQSNVMSALANSFDPVGRLPYVSKRLYEFRSAGNGPADLEQ